MKGAEMEQEPTEETPGELGILSFVRKVTIGQSTQWAVRFWVDAQRTSTRSLLLFAQTSKEVLELAKPQMAAIRDAYAANAQQRNDQILAALAAVAYVAELEAPIKGFYMYERKELLIAAFSIAESLGASDAVLAELRAARVFEWRKKVN